MTASRVRLVLVIWLLALLVVIVATWQAIAVPHGAASAEEIGSGTLVVAASTLLAAVLFQPIQRPVDRRFKRSHLDAERVVAGILRRTRDEVDLDRSRGAVVGTVSVAVRPAGAVLWLRGAR